MSLLELLSRVPVLRQRFCPKRIYRYPLVNAVCAIRHKTAMPNSFFTVFITKLLLNNRVALRAGSKHRMYPAFVALCAYASVVILLILYIPQHLRIHCCPSGSSCRNFGNKLASLPRPPRPRFPQKEQELKLRLSELLASANSSTINDREKDDTRQHDGEPTEEVAFGPTPAYSVSKAAANAAVRTWAPRLASELGVRLVAVCPGDVLTGMSSEEEIARGEGIIPEEAALAVVDVALRGAEFLAGGFYRAGRRIGW